MQLARANRYCFQMNKRLVAVINICKRWHLTPCFQQVSEGFSRDILYASRLPKPTALCYAIYTGTCYFVYYRLRTICCVITLGFCITVYTVRWARVHTRVSCPTWWPSVWPLSTIATRTAKGKSGCDGAATIWMSVIIIMLTSSNWWETRMFLI